MAMKPQLWNTHQLSVEFGISYRGAASRLADVPIAEQRGKQAMYRLSDAAPALLGVGNGSAHRSGPRYQEAFKELGAPFSVSEHPVDEGIAVACLMLAERVPWQAATLAIYQGAPLAVACALYKSMVVQMALLVDELTEQLGVTWRNEDHHEIGPEPNWKALAAQVGEKVDRKAWRRHEAAMARRFTAITANGHGGEPLTHGR
jgi:hypothetical protein